MLPRCGRAAHVCEANRTCKMFSLLQLHFLKLANSQFACLCETSYKFGQGNGAIAACWQAKAGVEPPFAGCGRPFFLRARSSIVSYKQQSCNCSGGTIAMRDVLRETTRIRFGKAGAHPQLALGIAIAPETLSLITTF